MQNELTITQSKNFKMSLPILILTWIFVILSIRIFSALQGIPFISENLGSITAILLVYPPVLISLFYKSPLNYWRVTKNNMIYSFVVYSVISLIIFPAVFFFNHLYQTLIFGLHYQSATSPIWFMYTLTQILLVAFPEEFFFRGFLQESLSQIWPPQKILFGVPFGKSIIITSLVFALSHSLIHLQWWHIFIFFPALIFAWLKEKTGTIWAGTLFHASCNLFSYWAFLHYKP